MLPANDAHYRVMYERSAFGVVMTTLDGWILAANPAACELLGRAVDEVVGVPVSRFIHPDEQEDSRSHIVALARGATETGRLERRLVRADGTAVWIDTQSQLVLDADGSPAYLQAMFQDVTDR